MTGEPSRIPKYAPATLDAAQRALYDSITGGRRAQGPQLFRLVDDEGRLEGPFNAFLLQPGLGAALQAVGTAVRYEGTLEDRSREIAILVVAAVWQCDFEVYAHEAVGRSVGLTAAELAGIRAATYDVLGAPEERTLALTVHALATHGDLDDKEYALALGALGLSRLFEVLTLVGYYSTLALQLRVFRVASPEA